MTVTHIALQKRQCNHKATPFPYSFAFGPDLSAVGFDEAAGDGEADAASAAR